MIIKRITVLLFISVFFSIVPQVFAQMIPMDSITPSPIPKSNEIEYPLPYPGILPNKPLFILKDLRDKLLEVFTINPLKKTELYLLQADKNLSSSIVLFDLGKENMALRSFVKSQKYLEKAIDEEEVAKNSPGSLMELSAKITQSSRKQTEIARAFYKDSKDEIKTEFKKVLDNSNYLEKRAGEFRL